MPQTFQKAAIRYKSPTELTHRITPEIMPKIEGEIHPNIMAKTDQESTTKRHRIYPRYLQHSEPHAHTIEIVTQHNTLRIAQDLRGLCLRPFEIYLVSEPLQGTQTLRTAYNGSDAETIASLEKSNYCDYILVNHQESQPLTKQRRLELHSVIEQVHESLQRYTTLPHTNNNLSCRAYSPFYCYSARAMYSHREHLPPPREYCA